MSPLFLTEFPLLYYFCTNSSLVSHLCHEAKSWVAPEQKKSISWFVWSKQLSILIVGGLWLKTSEWEVIAFNEKKRYQWSNLPLNSLSIIDVFWRIWICLRSLHNSPSPYLELSLNSLTYSKFLIVRMYVYPDDLTLKCSTTVKRTI